LGCEGDTIAVTAATQPSIEDVVMGAIPIGADLSP
jgi:hydrogenase small subunit